MEYSKYELIMRQSRVYESKYEYGIKNARDIYEFATKIMEADLMPEEHFWVLSVSTSGKIIGFFEASKGIINQSLVRPAEIFRPAILQNASVVAVVHNHPSGDPKPSDMDIKTTERLVKAGDILGITVLDHIVIGDGCYVGMKENGLM